MVEPWVGSKTWRSIIECKQLEDIVPRDVLDGACLLCSEYLKKKWGDVEIAHL
jgi:hypothetical protein